jgi:hypothetical protein
VRRWSVELTGLLWLVCLVCLLAGGVSLLAQSQRMGAPGGPAAGPQATGTAILLGQVVDGATGQPIDSAAVTLLGGRGGGGRGAQAAFVGPGLPPVAAASGPIRLITDASGHFVFHDLPTGSFPITATAPGYLPGTYGQTRPNGPSRPVDVADGARLGDLKIRLWKFGAITGVVIDDLGEPAVGVSVWALRKTSANGVPRLVQMLKATSDDRGEYRLAPLVPGDYVVAIPESTVTMPVAAVQSVMDTVLSGRGAGLLDFVASGGPPPSPGGTRIGDNLLQVGGDPRAVPPPPSGGHASAYLTQYFPAASVPAQAALLTVKSGEEKGGINLQLRSVPTATVTGVVTGPTGPLANALVTLTLAAVDDAALTSGFDTATTLTRADGTFTLLAVPAGQYSASIVKMPRPTIPPELTSNPFVASFLGPVGAPDPTQPTVPLYGEVAVTVATSDVSLGSIGLREGARLSGRIEFAGTTTPPRPQQVQSLTVVLTPVDGRSIPNGRGFMPEGPTPMGDQAGQFKTVGYPPGRYTLSVSGPVPSGWTLKSAVVNGRDVLTAPLEIAGADLDDGVLTYTDKSTQVSGVVRGGTTGENAVVLIYPADVKTWIAEGMNARRFRQTTASGTGSYSATNILPGDYCVAALNETDVPENPDAVFFDALSGVAMHVTLADGDKKTADLTVARIK